MRFPWLKFLGDVTEWIILCVVAFILTSLFGLWPGLTIYLMASFAYWHWRGHGGHQ
jgi:hypothetical protein